MEYNRERYAYLGSSFTCRTGGFTDIRAGKGLRHGADRAAAGRLQQRRLARPVRSPRPAPAAQLPVHQRWQRGWTTDVPLQRSRARRRGQRPRRLDRDGYLDLVVCTGVSVRLLRNDTTKLNWLQVSVKGGMGFDHKEDGRAWSNAAGIGTRVTLTLGNETFTREVQSGKGSGCGNELIAHFGLGARRGRMTITVRFPSGREVTRALIEAQQRYEIRETDAATPTRPEQPPVGPTRGLGR